MGVLLMRDYVRRIYLNHWRALEEKRDDFGECVRKMEEFKATHRKITDINVYNWFNEWALPALKIYVSSTKGEISYNICNDRIDVQIKYNEDAVLLCSLYDDMAELMKISSATWLSLDDAGMIVLEMTFNMFHWEEK